MHHHSCVLIHHENIRILVKNFERDILRDQFELTDRIWQHDGNHILGFNFVVGFNRRLIHQDVSGIGGILNFAS